MSPVGKPMSDQPTYANLLYYGPEGTGKTTNLLRMTKLCTSKDQYIFLVDAEAGAKKEALQQRGVDVSKIRFWPDNPSELTYDGLVEVSDQLAEEKGKCVGAGLDSYTEITRRLLETVVTEAKIADAAKNKKRGKFQINLEDYGTNSSMLRDVLRRFRDLPMHTIITALERRDVDEDTGFVVYGPAMSPAVAVDTLGLVDIVGYTSVEEVGTELIRSAHFVPVQRRRAKDRFGLLPAKMADPYADRILDYISGKLTKENDPIQKHVRELAMAALEGKAPGATTTKTEPMGDENAA